MIQDVLKTTTKEQPILHGDLNYRVRIKNELFEIEKILEHCNKEEDIPALLIIWHKNISKLLRHHDLKEVVDCFALGLEEIFIDPLNTECPFDPLYFTEEASDTIRSISIMRNPYSLFYSELLNSHAPPPISITEDDGLDEEIREINAIAAELLNIKREAMLPEKEFKDRLWHEATELNRQVSESSQKAMSQFIQLGKEIKEFREEIKVDKEHYIEVAEKLHNEAVALRQQAEELKKKTENVNIAMSEVERSNAQLQIAINETAAAQKERKSSWILDVALIAVSVVVTWGISKLLVQGVASQFFKGGVGVAATITLPQN
jgi:hypothetical protein